MSSPSIDPTSAIAGSVLAVRVADRTGILVRGGERSSWLNGLLTCDLAKLAPEKAAYGLIVEKKGRIQTDLFLLPSLDRDAFVLAVPRALRAAVMDTLDHYLVMEDAEIEPLDLDLWLLEGPRAADVAAETGAPFGGAIDLLGSAAVAAPSSDEAFSARVAAVVGAAGGAVADEATWDALRIERGTPRFGVEFDATLYPQEASLEKVAVSFDKGCYLGQEVVYMLENRGHVKRKLVPLDVEGAEALAPGATVTTPTGAPAGDVRSSVIGPRTNRPVAIAMIKWSETKPGTELRIGDRIAHVRA